MEYWPSFEHLDPESRDRWATGALLRTVNIPHAAGLAAHSFAWVVERELRTKVIDRFRAAVPPKVFTVSAVDDELFIRYLQGYGTITLGQILRTIEQTAQPRSPLQTTFREWLKREYPWLPAGVQRSRTDRIIGLRNREDHADLQGITPAEASNMRQTCYDLLSLLHQSSSSSRTR